MSTAAVLSDFFTAALREARSERPASLASRIPALDELTEGGFPVNALTELFIPHAGIGEVRMLLPALASLKHVCPATRRRLPTRPPLPTPASILTDSSFPFPLRLKRPSGARNRPPPAEKPRPSSSGSIRSFTGRTVRPSQGSTWPRTRRARRSSSSAPRAWPARRPLPNSV